MGGRFFLLLVFHFTTSFSSPVRHALCKLPPPLFTIFSDSMSSFTLPMRGTLPHPIGAKDSAAIYRNLPLVVGRCGCVEGKRCSEMSGLSTSCGRGFWSIVGNCSCSMRMVFPSCTVRSSGGRESESRGPLGVKYSFWLSKGSRSCA